MPEENMPSPPACGPELQEFEVEIQRQAWGNHTFKVRAATLELAQEIALDEAGNHVFSEKESEYVLVDAPAPREQANTHGMTLVLGVGAEDDSCSAVAGVTWRLDEPALLRLEADARLCATQGFSELRRFFYAHECLYREGSIHTPSLDSPELCVGKSDFWLSAQAEARITTPAVNLQRLRQAFDAGVRLYVSVFEMDPLEFLDSAGLLASVQGAQLGVEAVVVGPCGEMKQMRETRSMRERGQN